VRAERIGVDARASPTARTEGAGKGGGACSPATPSGSLFFDGERRRGKEGIRVAGTGTGSAFRRREAKRRGQLVFGSVGVGLGLEEWNVGRGKVADWRWAGEVGELAGVKRWWARMVMTRRLEKKVWARFFFGDKKCLG